MEPAIAWRDGGIAAIDQTALPHEFRMLRITTVDQLVDAITRLAIRGAPVLGAAGALGVALAIRQSAAEGWDDDRLSGEIARIAGARPTAVNLRREAEETAAEIPLGPAAVEALAVRKLETASEATIRMSERAAAFLREASAARGQAKLRVHTHCSTGSPP